MVVESLFSGDTYTGHCYLNREQRLNLMCFIEEWNTNCKSKPFVEHPFLKESMSLEEWHKYSWIRQYVLRFRDQYLKIFGEDKLLEDIYISQDLSILSIVKLLIALSHEAVDYYKRLFRENLRIAVAAFKETYEDKELRFRNYEPFINASDYLQFGKLNYKNEDFVYFDYLIFCLLKVQMDEAEDLNRDKANVWYSTQVTIINDYVQGTKYTRPAYHQIMRIFQRINDTHYFEFPLNISKNLANAIQNPSKLVSWDNVTFENGFYIIKDTTISSSNTTNYPLRVTDAKSRKEFNYILAQFEKRLPPIKVELENDTMRRVLNKPQLSEVIELLEKRLKSCREANKPINQRNGNKNNEMHREEFSKSKFKSTVKDYKSPFLEYLANAQSEEYKVVCLSEYRVNSNGLSATEYAFLFTLDTYDDLIMIAMENSLDKRCTYAFLLHKKYRDIAVKEICDFFSSDYENKRSAMASKTIKFNIPGGWTLRRFTHSNYYTWRANIDHRI